MSSSISTRASADHDGELNEETGSNFSSRPTFDDGSQSPDPALLEDEEDFETPRALRSDPKRVPATTGEGGYNALKMFNGQVYSGMAIGGSHTWNYDQGIWKETKDEPDLWKIDFKTTKRRARTAPKGSGAPVGAQYHWLIVAHQYVEKLDANTYDTHLVGSKYKLAHKTASKNVWSIPTVKAQREREVELLDDAKRRVQGLPPVVKDEKVKVVKQERGQQKLDTLFAKVRDDHTDDEPSRKKAKRDR